MKLNNVLDLLEQHKLIVIITPNVHEAKLLSDRFKMFTTNLIEIGNYIFQYNESKLFICHTMSSQQECPLLEASHVIVEFPDACSKNLFKRLPAMGVAFCEEIV